MEAAFDLGAGFSAGDLGIFIRGMIASLITLWGAWVTYKQYQLVDNGRMEIGDWGANVIKMVLLVVFVLIIVGV